MDVSLQNLLMTLYIAGVLINLIFSIKFLFNIENLKIWQEVDLLAARPDLKRYLILKPILWPYYFLTEKGPIERLSELLFKNYGDAGHTYFGSRGLKNFLNDLFLGKNRYEKCQIQSLCWPGDTNAKDVIELKKIFGDKTYNAHIIYTIMRDKYILIVLWDKSSKPRCANSVSRFELDQGERLDKQAFKARLECINPAETRKLFDELNG